MCEGYVAVLDSGIGGISTLSKLVKVLPNQRFIYHGDNKNAPYGNKSKNFLINRTFEVIDRLKKYHLKAIVLACGTLSTVALEEIKEQYKIKVFGVFPPIEKEHNSNQKSLLLATENTAKNYKNIKGLLSVGLPNLAIDIENNKFNIDGVDVIKHIKDAGLLKIEKSYFDSIILGCTHYVFVKNKIFNHFCPQKIVSGNDFTAKLLSNYLQGEKSSVKIKGNQVLFIGDCASENLKFWGNGGQRC